MKKYILLVLLALGLVAFVPQKSKADGYFGISVGPAYYDPYPAYYGDYYPNYYYPRYRYRHYYYRHYYYDDPYGYEYRHWRHHRHWHHHEDEDDDD